MRWSDYKKIQAYYRAMEEEKDIDEVDELQDDWQPGDAPWDAPGMSMSDFIR